MPVLSPENLATAYLKAIEQRDFDQAKSYLDPERFSYLGPTMDFNDAESFIADITRVGPITNGIEIRKTFVKGNDVCVIYTFLATIPELNNTRIAHWFTCENGRITAMEVFFDAHPYSKMIEEPREVRKQQKRRRLGEDG